MIIILLITLIANPLSAKKLTRLEKGALICDEALNKATGSLRRYQLKAAQNNHPDTQRLLNALGDAIFAVHGQCGIHNPKIKKELAEACKECHNHYSCREQNRLMCPTSIPKPKQEKPKDNWKPLKSAPYVI